MVHLRVVLKTLKNQQLFAKAVNCKFGYHEIEYLVYVISTKEVKANLAKIEGMIKWPLPKSLKSLRGFLGLTGYYKNFIKGYGQIAALLTSLIKNDYFLWTAEYCCLSLT